MNIHIDYCSGTGHREEAWQVHKHKHINTAINPLPCLKPDQSDPKREVNIPRNEQRLVTMFIWQFVNAIVSPIGTQDGIVEK